MGSRLRQALDSIIERRIIGKLATILCPVLFGACCWLAAQLWAATAAPATIHAATLAAANRYTDQNLSEMKDTMNWMAATMEAKWNVRRPRSR